MPKLLGFCCPAGHHPFKVAKKAEIPPRLLFTSNEACGVSQSEPSSLLEEHRSYTESLHTEVPAGLCRGAPWNNDTLKLEQPQSGVELQSLEGQPRKWESPCAAGFAKPAPAARAAYRHSWPCCVLTPAMRTQGGTVQSAHALHHAFIFLFPSKF